MENEEEHDTFEDCSENSESSFNISLLDNLLNGNAIPNLVASTPIFKIPKPSTKLQENINLTSSTISPAFQTAFSGSAFEEYRTPNSTLVGLDLEEDLDFVPASPNPNENGQIEEEELGTTTPMAGTSNGTKKRGRGRPPRVPKVMEVEKTELKITEVPVVTVPDHQHENESSKTDEETFKTVLQGTSSVVDQDQEDEKVIASTMLAEVNAEENNDIPDPEVNDNVRNLRKRAVKKIVPKKRVRTKASIDEGPSSELLMPILQVEVPESGNIYDEGMVWEEKPAPRISCGSSNGILKVGSKRDHNEADLVDPDVPETESPSKRIRTGNSIISFAEEPHVRFYHSPHLLKKRRPVRKGIKKKNKKTPDNEVDLNLSVELIGDVDPGVVNNELDIILAPALVPEPGVEGQKDVDVNENKLKLSISTTKPKNISIGKNDTSPVPVGNDENSNNANDGTSSTLTPISFSPVSTPKFGVPPGFGGFNFALGIDNSHSPSPSAFHNINGDDDGVSMGFDVQAESDLVMKNTKTENQASGTGKPRLSIPLNELPLMSQTPMDEEYSEEFVNSENGSYSTVPVCPSLMTCKELVTSIIPKLTHGSMCKALENVFDACGILTIGDLSGKTQGDIINWPINHPRYQTVVSALLEYKNSALRSQSSPFQPQARIEIEKTEETKTSVILTENGDKVNGLLTKPILVEINEGIISPKRTSENAIVSSPIEKRDIGCEKINENTFDVDDVEMNSPDENRAGTPTSIVSTLNPHLNFDSLAVLRNLSQFLGSASTESSDFLETLLTSDLIAEKITEKLMKRADFPTLYWNIARKEHDENKTPKSLCDFILTKEVSKMYRQKFGSKLPIEIPANFWKQILSNLQDCYLHTFNQNATFVPEDLNMKFCGSDLNFSTNSTISQSELLHSNNVQEIEVQHDKTLLYFSRCALNQIENKNNLSDDESTVESIETKYMTALKEVNRLGKELMEKKTGGNFQASDSQLSEELLTTTLLLTKSMDNELLGKFLIKLTRPE